MIQNKIVNPVEINVMEAIAKRWSPRAFSSKSIEKEILLTILEAARWAASSYNEQPWRFILATKDTPEAYQTMLSCLNDWNQKWAHLAPVLLLTIVKKIFTKSGKPNGHAWHDLGQAVATMNLEAVTHDIYLHSMAGIHTDKAKELYNIPDDYEVVSAIALGHLGDINDLPEEFHKSEKRVRERKPLSELVFEHGFGQPFSLIK